MINWTSADIIKFAKKRYRQLKHKNYDWRSYYAGILEAWIYVYAKWNKENKLCVGCGQKVKMYKNFEKYRKCYVCRIKESEFKKKARYKNYIINKKRIKDAEAIYNNSIKWKSL